MIDSLRCASCRGLIGDMSVIPAASGPRWPMRSAIVRTRPAPSGWRNAPAMPHTLASHSISACKCVEDTDVSIALMRPAQLFVDPNPSGPTHHFSRAAVVEEFNDCLGIGCHIAAKDV